MSRPSLAVPVAAGGGARIAGLDAWRALLMLGGLFVHGTTYKGHRALFDAINLASDTFRMGTFFAISGLLGGFSLSRKAVKEWLRSRLIRLGVPTLFGLVVICPLTSLLVLLEPGSASRQQVLRFDWYHLWFLVGLLAFTGMAVGIRLIDRRYSLFPQIDEAFAKGGHVQLPILLLIGAISLLLMVASILAIFALAPREHLRMLWQTRQIIAYAPLYFFGLALAQAPRFRAAMLSGVVVPIVILGLIAAGFIGWYGWLSAQVGEGRRDLLDGVLHIVGASLAPPAVTLLALRSALAMRSVPVALRRLSEASFTIYLVHFPAILAINLLFLRVDWDEYLEYVLAILLVGLASYGFHVRVVQRSALLALLFNGIVRSGHAPVAPAAALGGRARAG